VGRRVGRISFRFVPSAAQHGQARVARKRRIGPRALAHPERAALRRDRARVLAWRAQPYLHSAVPRAAFAEGSRSGSQQDIRSRPPVRSSPTRR